MNSAAFSRKTNIQCKEISSLQTDACVGLTCIGYRMRPKAFFLC